jgi:glucokinase
MKYTIGIDLGGTNIAAGIMDEGRKILLKKSVKTDMSRGFKGLCQDMSNLCFALIEAYNIIQEDVRFIGIGCPGMINEVTGEIIFSNNLDLYHEALSKTMRKLLGRPVFVANDANAAALGEYEVGAGASAHSMVAITLGTGVGSGIIIDSRIIGGFNYSGGELGHMVIQRDGRPCTCGRKGCLESYASATGLIKSAQEAMMKDQNSLMWSLVNQDINQVTGKVVFDARDQEDKVATEVIEDYIEVLALGLANIVNAIQPEVIAVGGGISHQGQWLIDALQKKVDHQVFGRFGNKQTKIVVASLGNDAGIIGAALLGRDEDDC